MKRTQKKDFVLLRDILDRSRSMKLIRNRNNLDELRSVWQNLWKDSSGDGISSSNISSSIISDNSRVVRYQGGKLFVEVFSAPLLLELSSFRKQKIIQMLRQFEPLKGLVDIVFRNGSRVFRNGSRVFRNGNR